jgi:hypothetical protein
MMPPRCNYDHHSRQPEEINILDLFFGDGMSDAALEELIADDQDIESPIGAAGGDEPEVEFEPAHGDEAGASDILGDAAAPDAHQPTETEPDHEADADSDSALPTCVVCMNDVEVGEERWRCDGYSLQLHLDCVVNTVHQTSTQNVRYAKTNSTLTKVS